MVEYILWLAQQNAVWEVAGIYLFGAHYQDLNHLGDNKKKVLPRELCVQVLIFLFLFFFTIFKGSALSSGRIHCFCVSHMIVSSKGK